MCRPRLALIVAASLLTLGAAAPTLASPCDEAIRVVEAEQGLPPGLLRAIGLVESGRTTAAGYAPWPWTVNSPEGGVYLESHGAAVARVEALQARGHRNIDVGCMQINLRHHPDAFRSLAEALDPRHNVGYAARFLAALKRETGTWQAAIGRYHSATPNLATAYRERVAARWDPTPPAPVSTAPKGPVLAAAVPPRPGIVRPPAPEPTRGAVAETAVRVTDTVPARAGPGAIGGFARRSQPVAFTPMERLAGQHAPGALRPR